MTTAQRIAIFDGHNDTLLRLHLADQNVAPFFDGRKGHIDAIKARAGRLGGGFFAVFVPSPADSELLAAVDDDAPSGEAAKPRTPWNRDHVPYSPSVDVESAISLASSVVDLLERLIDTGAGRVVWMRSRADLGAALDDFDADRFDDSGSAKSAQEPLRLVLHFEGAEPIRDDLSNLEHWYQRGLRSLGLVWSRRNAFAAGVPFRFPSTPDHYEGLSKAGRDLVLACDELGVLIDLAHLNERGFWDTSRLSRKPLVVTHSGALSICPSSRNLTDDQIKAVGDSGGVVGINLHCGDLRPDGRLNRDTPMEVVVRHVERIAELAGIQHVALGSDFDGALMPKCLSDASRLPTLIETLVDRGWSEEDVRSFAYRNWLRILDQAWA